MFLNYYYKKIILYDFVNKFKYRNINQVPCIKKIILYLNYKKIDLKLLLISLMVLELLASQKSIITKAKKINIKLKIKKGSPVGCKITIRKNNIYFFITKLIFNNILDKELYTLKINSNKFTINLKIKNILNFSELKKYYNIIKNLYFLNVTIVMNSRTNKEFIYFLLSYKFFKLLQM